MCDSKRRCGIGGIGFFPKRKRQKTDFDYDEIATAVIRGLASSRRKLPKMFGAQVEDIRSIFDSLTMLDDVRDCHNRDLIPSFLLQRICLQAAYTGRCYRISDDELLDCLHTVAYPAHELDSIAVEDRLLNCLISCSRE